MSDDLYISAADTEITEAFLLQIDTILGYPCCGCNAEQDPNCTCTKHIHPDGSPASHVGSCTLRHTAPIIHPDYKANPEERILVIKIDPVIMSIRNNQELVDAKLTSKSKDDLYAVIDSATTINLIQVAEDEIVEG